MSLPICLLISTLVSDPTARLAELERRSGGRLGVVVFDTGTGSRFEHRPKERFTLCSTFKVLLVGQALSWVDAGKLRLDERLSFTEKDLQSHAPVCRARVKEGALSVADLCAAALQVSDNTAANLLLRRMGGPAALTTWLRSIGDSTTRLDRYEPELNLMAPGDLRDTSTPAAMGATLQLLLTGRALTSTSQHLLMTWMADASTGLKRLRAGLPTDWKVLDKTGGGYENNPFNDIAMATPPGRSPIFITAYLADAKVDTPGKEAVLAEIGRIVAASLSR